MRVVVCMVRVIVCALCALCVVSMSYRVCVCGLCARVCVCVCVCNVCFSVWGAAWQAETPRVQHAGVLLIHTEACRTRVGGFNGKLGTTSEGFSTIQQVKIVDACA